jgi:hypothetical protein
MTIKENHSSQVERRGFSFSYNALHSPCQKKEHEVFVYSPLNHPQTLILAHQDLLTIEEGVHFSHTVKEQWFKLSFQFSGYIIPKRE